jgi:hypothetical protein
MWVVHQEIASLWFKHVYGEGCSMEEIIKLKNCLDAHMRKAQKLADLENQSLMASIINDTKMHHEICKKIDAAMADMYEYK